MLLPKTDLAEKKTVKLSKCNRWVIEPNMIQSISEEEERQSVFAITYISWGGGSW